MAKELGRRPPLHQMLKLTMTGGVAIKAWVKISKYDALFFLFHTPRYRARLPCVQAYRLPEDTGALAPCLLKSYVPDRRSPRVWLISRFCISNSVKMFAREGHASRSISLKLSRL